MIDFHVKRFVDRERELAALAELARRPAPGYLIVWAEGGLGKSSLLAELIDRHRRGGWLDPAPALVYFFVRADGARNTSVAFLQAANAQLLELLGLPGGTPSQLDELRAQFSELWPAASAAAGAGTPLLLVVDAVDEMAAELTDVVDVLPTLLGAYVHVVVSTRPNPDPRELVAREHPLRSAAELVLGPFDEPSVAEVLVSFELDAPQAAELTPRVVELTGGEPLFTRLVGQELAAGGEAALAALEREPPSDAEDYFRDQLRGLSERAAGDLSWDIVGVLAIALGRLTATELGEILEARLRDVRQALAPMDRFLLGTDAFELFHRRLRDAVAGEFSSAELDGYRERVLAWCRRYQAEGWPERTPVYVLENLARLLADAGEVDELAALPDRHWMSRRRATFGSLAGFAGDLATALTAALGVAGPAPSAAEIRLALVQVTLRSIATTAPADAIAVLAHAGRTAEALGFAELAGNTTRQAAAYRAVAEAMVDLGRTDEAARLLAQGLEVLDPDEYYEEVAAELRAYASMLGRLGLTEGLERVCELAASIQISDAAASALAGAALGLIAAGAADRAVAIGGELLAVPAVEDGEDGTDPVPRLAAAAEVAAVAGTGELIGRVVERAEQLDAPIALTAAAAAAAQRGDGATAGRLADRAIGRAREETFEDARPGLFGQIARRLAPVLVEQARVAADASLSAAENISDFWRSYALEEAVSALEAVGDLDGLDRIWRAAIDDEDRDAVFAVLAGAYARRGDAERALAAYDAIPPGDGSYQALAMRDVVAGLAGAGKFDEALAAAPRVPAAAERAEAVAAVARGLHEAGSVERALEVAEQAIAESEQIEDAHSRAPAFGSFASALAAAGATDQALAAAHEAQSVLSTIGPESRTGAAIGPVVTALATVGLVDESLAIVAENEASFLGPDLLGKLGLALAQRGEHEAARLVADLLEEGAPDSHRGLEMSVAAAEVLGAIGDKAEAEARLAATVAAAKALSPEDDGVTALAWIAAAYARLGDGEAASEVARAAETRFEEKNREEAQWSFASEGAQVAAALASAGRDDEAAALATRALDVHLSDPSWLPSIDAILVAARALGPAAGTEALRRAEAAVAAPSTRDRAATLAAVAVAYHELGRTDDAGSCLRDAIHAAALTSRYAFLDVVALTAPTIVAQAGTDTLVSLMDSLREIDTWWG